MDFVFGETTHTSVNTDSASVTNEVTARSVNIDAENLDFEQEFARIVASKPIESNTHTHIYRYDDLLFKFVITSRRRIYVQDQFQTGFTVIS